VVSFDTVPVLVNLVGPKKGEARKFSAIPPVPRSDYFTVNNVYVFGIFVDCSEVCRPLSPVI
jgi:hypothetical protein